MAKFANAALTDPPTRKSAPGVRAARDQIAAGYGPDPYPYGIAESRRTIDAFCRYAHDQGVTHRRMTAEDLFPREVQATARV